MQFSSAGSTGSTLLLSKPFLESNYLGPEPMSFLLFGTTAPHWAKISSFMKFLAQTMMHHSQ